MTSPTPPQPPYQPQTGWAGMAQHAQQPQYQTQYVPAAVRHSPTAGLIAIGAGAAMVLGSFLPWATISAPIIGSISMAGTDGSDGWVTVVAGLLLVGYGFAARARQLPVAYDVAAALTGLGAIGWAAWHIYDLEQIGQTMQAGMAGIANDDPFGIASSMASATQVSIGAGLWLLILAGLVATFAAGMALYKRLG